MRRLVRLLLLSSSLLVLSGCQPVEKASPRLVVTVVVDGLGTRQLLRHEAVLDAGGFARLLEQGAFFEQARFAHTTTFTGAGHGTIASGTNPREHGLVGNAWYDADAARRVYCVEDPQTHTVGGARSKRGVSPRNLMVPTLADVLYLRSDKQSRSLAVSLKDRGSVTGSGRHGMAYWFDNDSGRFQSSTYFVDEMPGWWTEYYQSPPQNRYLGAPRRGQVHRQDWHARYAAVLDKIRAKDVRIRDFHDFSSEASRDYYYELKSSPHGDDLTFDFLREVLRHGDLGRVEGRLDQLFVSFSAHDYVSHDVGPDSPEASAVIENLDRLLAEFFDLLDETIGRGAWVLAFTADHGYPETPEVVAARGEDAGRLDPEQLAAGVDAHLDAVFGPRDWVRQWAVPTFYLEHPPGVDSSEVDRQAKSWLEKQPGIAAVYGRQELSSDTATEDSLLAGARASFRPERSGDLLVLQKPNWYLLYDPRADVCTHGSPWGYDREVPLIFLGAGVRPGHYQDDARVRDLAPTLLALVGEKPASFMTGRVLRAALRSDDAH